MKQALRPGMRGEVVKQLHLALAELGLSVDASDAYTWVTSEAIAQAQKLLGIHPADGLYTKETADKINELLAVRAQQRPSNEDLMANVEAMVPVIRDIVLPLMDYGLAKGAVDASSYDKLAAGLAALDKAIAVAKAAKTP